MWKRWSDEWDQRFLEWWPETRARGLWRFVLI